MSDDLLNPAILRIEQLIISTLCTLPGSAIGSKIKSSLSSYPWRSTDHSVLFEALKRLSAAQSSADVREQLPAQLTRMGFPDVNYEIYFEGEIPKESEIPTLIATLRRAATSTPI